MIMSCRSSCISKNLLFRFLLFCISRFAALTRNIRYRRGGKVDIKMPLFRDIRTPEFLRLGKTVKRDTECTFTPFANPVTATATAASGFKDVENNGM